MKRSFIVVSIQAGILPGCFIRHSDWEEWYEVISITELKFSIRWEGDSISYSKDILDGKWLIKEDNT